MVDIETANYLAAIGTVLVQLGVVVLIGIYFVPSSIPQQLRAFITNFGLWGAFFITLFASLVTLYYSEILGAEPCGLCWLQRVFLYPQVVIFGIAAWKKDISVASYSIALSILGALVALYQHYLQMGGYDAFPCPATGSAADCVSRTLFEFGYITYPFMAFSLFIFLIVGMLLVRQRQRM